LTQFAELPSDFEGDRAARAVASQKVRALRLSLPYLLDQVGAQFLDRVQWPAAVQPGGLYSQQRLAWVEMVRQVNVAEYVTVVTGEAEQRRPLSIWLQRHDRVRPVLEAVRVPKDG
jgi:hypothetical protein